MPKAAIRVSDFRRTDTVIFCDHILLVKKGIDHSQVTIVLKGGLEVTLDGSVGQIVESIERAVEEAELSSPGAE